MSDRSPRRGAGPFLSRERGRGARRAEATLPPFLLVLLLLLLLLPLLAGCGGGGERPAANGLRQAAFDVAAARAVVVTCPGAGGRADLAAEDRRFDDLRQLAAAKGASYPIWAGGNDYVAMARQHPGPGCGAGAGGYDRALRAYRSALDALAGRIAQYRR